MKLFCLAFLLVSVQFASAQTEWAKSRSLSGEMTLSFEYDGREFKYTLSEEQLKVLPSWDFADGEPPISMSKASEAAMARASEYLNATKQWRLTEIQLKELSSGKWYYLAYIYCIDKSCDLERGYSFPVIVTMDGIALEPKVTNPAKEH